jgi:maltose O-acetyltransferase
MISGLTICNAQETDADELTSISFAAKRHWKYPEHYYELWKNELTITSEYIHTNQVFKAIHKDISVGYYSLVKNDKDFYAGDVLVKQGYYLEHIFILPLYHNKGIGRSLIQHMKQHLTNMSITNVLVFADPYSRGFYDKTGAEFLYDSKSSIPGRMIPVYKYII